MYYQVTCPEFLVSGFNVIGNINKVVPDPALGITGESTVKNPYTGKPADHSMAPIVSRTLRTVVGSSLPLSEITGLHVVIQVVLLMSRRDTRRPSEIAGHDHLIM